MSDAEKNILAALSTSRNASKPKPEPPKTPEQTARNFFWLGIALLFIIAFASTLGYLYVTKAPSYSNGPVHWHALINISICGELRDLPTPRDNGLVHGERYLGTPLLHTHEDNTLHIEGIVYDKQDITLGAFFDAIEVPFDSHRLFEYTNGDLCPNGTNGTLRMHVNGQPRTDFREYVPVATTDAQQQVITLVFG